MTVDDLWNAYVMQVDETMAAQGDPVEDIFFEEHAVREIAAMDGEGLMLASYQLWKAARVWVIAKDVSLNAAMLWKLRQL